MTNPIPAGYHTLTSSLVFKNARKAIEFYKKAFGAHEVDVMTTSEGRVMHCEMKIGDSMFMLGEENPAWAEFKSAETMGGSPVSMHLYVPDAEATYTKAVKAGCKGVMPCEDTFWGDRFGKVQDPFGYLWGIGTRVKEMSKSEIAKAGKEWMNKMAVAARK